ncbi:unnamed protein product [Caenorhabditis auriculariae]|uniref:Transmembrane protein n=1 Tax=Caenorhabditis auriculariae TaxID=2777116 RepID=A0A8S1GX02_9PELO|nr:unnamed protein product [Caenorhabditis auriculariae]
MQAKTNSSRLVSEDRMRNEGGVDWTARNQYNREPAGGGFFLLFFPILLREGALRRHLRCARVVGAHIFFAVSVSVHVVFRRDQQFFKNEEAQGTLLHLRLTAATDAAIWIPLEKCCHYPLYSASAYTHSVLCLPGLIGKVDQLERKF